MTEFGVENSLKSDPLDFFSKNQAGEKNIIALSIPTGVGAEIGGYAGDAGFVAREFSKHFKVILNPNVVNAGILSAINENMLYAEGYAFDEFFAGKINLKPVGRFNKIGVIFDKSIPDGVLNLHINTIEAMKVVKGYDIPYFEITEEPVGVSLSIDDTGISTGRIENEKTLQKAAKKLLDKGCEALAVVCYFNDECEDVNYEEGNGVDPIGGIEAVISHYLTKEFICPVAHSPAFSGLDITFKRVNYKVASEFISSTYLPCILDGLSMAPHIVSPNVAMTVTKLDVEESVSRDEVKCLIVPSGALGSKAVLSALEAGILICAVNNKTVLSIDCKKLLKNDIIGNVTDRIKEFSSYQNCLEFIRERYEKR